MSRYFQIVLGLLVALTLLSAATAAPQYEVTNLTEAVLAAYPGVESIDALFINEAGQVGGTCRLENITSAFLYEPDGQIHLLDAPEATWPGHGVITVSGANDQGQIVGISSDGAYLWDTNTGNYEVLFPEISNTLGKPEAALPVSWMDVRINNQGQIAGTGMFPQVSDLVNTFFWDSNDGFQIISKEGYYSSVNRLNESGGFTINYYEKAAQDPINFVAIWALDTGFIEVPWLEDARTMTPLEVDEQGNITIWVRYEETASALLWSEEDGFSDLPQTSTYDTWATSMNDLGEIIGAYTPLSGSKAVYWSSSSSEYATLDSLVEYDYSLEHAQDINNAGAILVESSHVPETGSFPAPLSGDTFLILTPIPEPGTFTMLVTLLGALTVYGLRSARNVTQ